MELSLVVLFFILIGTVIIFSLINLTAIVILCRNFNLLPILHENVKSLENKLTELLYAGSNNSEKLNEVWQTADGKYTADSFEELLSTMASDPDTPLTEEEIQAIKSIFDKITNSDNNEQ